MRAPEQASSGLALPSSKEPTLGDAIAGPEDRSTAATLCPRSAAYPARQGRTCCTPRFCCLYRMLCVLSTTFKLIWARTLITLPSYRTIFDPE